MTSLFYPPSVQIFKIIFLYKVGTWAIQRKYTYLQSHLSVWFFFFPFTDPRETAKKKSLWPAFTQKHG